LSYALGAGDGTKTLYTWYKDAAGNVSTIAAASILLDQTAPSNGTLTPTAASTQITLNWAGFTDAGSGLATTTPYKLVYATGPVPTSCASGSQIDRKATRRNIHYGPTTDATYCYH